MSDLEIATCGWVEWFNEERIHGELDDFSPAEVETRYHNEHACDPQGIAEALGAVA